MMKLVRFGCGVLVALGLTGCPAKPPASQFPDADRALERLDATFECSRGIGGEAKIDYFGDEGRIRANAMFQAALPERVRIDIFSPFGATLSTLTATESAFKLVDLHNKQYVEGPANQCSVSEFLRIPVPPHVLVQLLGGRAPILVHEPSSINLEWDSGAYALSIESKHQARQVVRLIPMPQDYDKPWQEQRLRVLSVQVEQEGIALYRAEFHDHKAAKTAPPRQDPDGLEPDVPPSGPMCHAEIPRRIRFEVPGNGQDVVFLHKDVFHNPPLVPTLFQQQAPRGVRKVPSPCARVNAPGGSTIIVQSAERPGF
jgi:hypothetical protein